MSGFYADALPSERSCFMFVPGQRLRSMKTDKAKQLAWAKEGQQWKHPIFPNVYFKLITIW